LETGKIPSDWNHANVTPVLIKGDKHNPGNYRPISEDVCTYINIFFQYSAYDGVRTSSFTRVYVFDEVINTIPSNFYEFHCGMSTRTFIWNVSVCFRCYKKKKRNPKYKEQYQKTKTKLQNEMRNSYW
jgi:hypothetical protein